MSNFITAHFDALVTVGVTILGFVINHFMTKRNFQEEIKKEKIGKTTEVIQSLPYKICTMMNSVLHGYKIEDNQYEEIMFKTLSYGSRDAVNIAIKAQQMTQSANKMVDGNRFLVLSLYALLITQLKYDLSSEIISPVCWFEMCISDYEIAKAKIVKCINDIVDELELNENFYV